MSTLAVSEYVKNKLDQIKLRNGHTSYDSVLRTLLLKDLGVKVQCKQNCLYNKDGLCQRESIDILTCMQIEPSLAETLGIKLPKIKGEKP